MKKVFQILFCFWLTSSPICLTTTTVIATTVTVNAQVKPFPNAYGCGANTTNDGWRGGTVVKVTSLADDYNNVQSGTLRWALTRTYPRIIVFDVSGAITLSGRIVLNNSHSNFYLAGQTSPNGIMIRGYSIYSSGLSDVVIRHVKFYGDATLQIAPNDPSSARRPSWQFVSPSNVIVDHCDFVYNANEAMNFWSSESIVAGGATMQNCLIGEGDTAVLMGGDECNTTLFGEYSAIRNLFVHVSHRHPNFTANVKGESINNVVYNSRSRLSRVSCTAQANFYGNYYKAGSATYFSQPNRINLVRDGDGADVYVDETYWSFMSGVVESASDSHTDIFNAATANIAKDPQPPISNWSLSAPVTLTGVRPTYLSNADAYTQVLADIGANKYLNADGSVTTIIDTKQQEYINDVINGTNTQGSGSDYGNDLGNYNHPSIALTTRPADYDSDGDGMPDAWEVATFGDLTRDGTGDYDGDGYTDLEAFLNLVDGPQTPSPPTLENFIKSYFKLNGKSVRFKNN